MRAPTRAAATLLLASSFLVGLPFASTGATFAPMAGTSLPAHGYVSGVVPSSASGNPDDYSSIFDGEEADLEDSGWSTCTVPIHWAVDAQALGERHTTTQIAQLTWAFSQWAAASGLAFAFDGVRDMEYDDAAFSLEPADGSEVESRHIYLSFISDEDTTRLSGATVGLGSPTQVMASTKTIVVGEAVFRATHITRASTNQVRNLYLHELGHVLGLAHATAKTNIMYPIVRARASLGAGDVNGIIAMTRPCTE